MFVPQNIQFLNNLRYFSKHAQCKSSHKVLTKNKANGLEKLFRNTTGVSVIPRNNYIAINCFRGSEEEHVGIFAMLERFRSKKELLILSFSRLLFRFSLLKGHS